MGFAVPHHDWRGVQGCGCAYGIVFAWHHRKAEEAEQPSGQEGVGAMKLHPHVRTAVVHTSNWWASTPVHPHGRTGLVHAKNWWVSTPLHAYVRRVLVGVRERWASAALHPFARIALAVALLVLSATVVFSPSASQQGAPPATAAVVAPATSTPPVKAASRATASNDRLELRRMLGER